MAATEGKIYLFHTLKKKGLATNVEEKNCQESILVENAGPLCRTLPAAVPTTSGDTVLMPEVNLPTSSDVIGCEEKDGPIGASL